MSTKELVRGRGGLSVHHYLYPEISERKKSPKRVGIMSTATKPTVSAEMAYSLPVEHGGETLFAMVGWH